MKIISNYQYTLCLAVLISLVSIGSANADRKILSGSSCQPNTASQAADFSYHSTGMKNNASSSRRITCSGVRDNTFNVNGVNFSRVYVAGTGYFSCYFDNVNNNGNLGSWDFADRNDTGSITFYLNSSTSQTPYAFMCYLPAGGKMVTTVVDEYLPTQ